MASTQIPDAFDKNYKITPFQRSKSPCPSQRPTPSPSASRRGSQCSSLQSSRNSSRRRSSSTLLVIPKPESSARSRWSKLANVISKKVGVVTDSNVLQQDSSETDSFRFPAFGVIDIRPDIAPDSVLDRLWFRVHSSPEWHESIDLKVCVRSQSMKLKDLTGFNNTGNVCVWPSEEVLGGYCLENSHLFHKKQVLELGGGMTGLAGLMVAQNCQPEHVEITDGNQNSIENLEIVIHENQSLGLLDNVSCRMIKWADGVNNLKSIYDVVICADCCFFDEGRPQLLECLKKALKPRGIAIIVAPSRSGTFEDFVQLTRESKSFVVTTELEHYSKKISEVREKLQSDPRYNENLHYPKLLMLEKSSCSA